MIRRIDHLGLAVRSIDESLRFWTQALGMEVAGREQVGSEGVEVAFLPVGGTSIELLEPTSEDSAVARFLAKRGEGFHHVTLEVSDLQAMLDRLASLGLTVLDEAPRLGSGGRRVAFVHPRSTGGVLLELVEGSRSHRETTIASGDSILAYLREPQEKLWGVLRRLDAAGLTIEGIDLASFDDWVSQIERGEESVIGPSVLFLPTMRLEKVLLDRPSGRLPSLADRFFTRTGRTVQQVLDEIGEEG